jgi:hypothetical protein
MYKSIAFLLAVIAVVGCGRKTDEGTESGVISDLGAKYLVEREPADAQGVGDALKASDEEAEVTVVGRIGGEEHPIIEGLAAFTIVDTSLKACSDIPGDNCEKPWDYCCEPRESLKANSVAVKFTDEKGSVVPVDARELFDVKPLQTVVLKGKLQKDKSGKTALIAEKMYVRK